MYFQKFLGGQVGEAFGVLRDHCYGLLGGIITDFVIWSFIIDEDIPLCGSIALGKQFDIGYQSGFPASGWSNYRYRLTCLKRQTVKILRLSGFICTRQYGNIVNHRYPPYPMGLVVYNYKKI
jgi:hypothetical protein